MKKEKKVIVFLIVAIIGLIGILLIVKKDVTFKKDRIMYALNVVDTSGNVTHPTNFPSKGPYNVKVNCSPNTGRWLYDEWKLQLKDPYTYNGSCSLTFTTIPKTTLASKIISLNDTTQGDGKVVNEPSTDYRYEGKNPNNYIWFNNEMWRIIGVFGSNTHGQSGNLVKIIRDESIGGLSWDKSNTNKWATSSSTASASLNKLLNTSYYNATDGTDSGYCYGYENISANCNYKIKGIQSYYRNMIQQVTWKLGGRADSKATAETFYSAERGTTVPSGASATYKGYIGLMYISDYGYSILSTSCSRTKNLYNYNISSCAGQSWLYGQDYEWTLVPRFDTVDLSFNIVTSGSVNSEYSVSYANHGRSVRPVLYLKSSVYVVDGDGSLTNPYIIMN